jgi:hypothetical protein
MFVEELGDGFDLDNDFAVAIEVRLVDFVERPTLVAQLQFWLGPKGDSAQPEFDLETFLVDRLKEPGALVIIDFESCPDDGVGLVFEKDFHDSSHFFLSIRLIRLIRG